MMTGLCLSRACLCVLVQMRACSSWGAMPPAECMELRVCAHLWALRSLSPPSWAPREPPTSFLHIPWMRPDKPSPPEGVSAWRHVVPCLGSGPAFHLSLGWTSKEGVLGQGSGGEGRPLGPWQFWLLGGAVMLRKGGHTLRLMPLPLLQPPPPCFPVSPMPGSLMLTSG